MQLFALFNFLIHVLVAVQLLSHVWLSVTPWTAACQASLSIPVSLSFHKLMPAEWYHPTISSSVIPFCSCLQSFLASGSFQMSQFFATGGQSIGVSASASALWMNIQDWFPLGWTGWISAVQGTLKSLLRHHSSKASILWPSAFFIVQFSHLYRTTGKTIALTDRHLLAK